MFHQMDATASQGLSYRPGATYQGTPITQLDRLILSRKRIYEGDKK
jgi:hypothetical protein